MMSGEPDEELRSTARCWFEELDVGRKVAGVRQMATRWRDGNYLLDAALKFDSTLPGRPENPLLVSPRDVTRRAMSTAEGRAALIHSLTHIEFTAVNLALDAVWRFGGMPDGFYADWIGVAEEEAMHFLLLEGHLRSLGYEYGSFTAHNSLWEMAERTQADVLARMALVPVTMEARGLDATPQLRDKLAQAGDVEAAEILDVILRDEIGHVAIGNRWYRYLCMQRELEPMETFERLIREYAAPLTSKPYNIEARRAAGFTETELARLTR
jgi:uncharacterized ferritin-like protein (DUF455 family)